MPNLAIWTNHSPQKTLSLLSPPLKFYPSIKPHVVDGFDDIAALQPGAVFSLGSGNLKILQEMGVAPKNRVVNSMRGQKLALPNGVPLMVSFHPAVSDLDHSLFVSLLTDTGMVARLAATGKLDAQLGQYRYVPHFKEFIARVTEKYLQTQQPVPVALDLETVGLDEYKLPNPKRKHPGAYIVSIQLTCDPGFSDVKYFTSRADEEAALADLEFASQVSWLLTSPMIALRGANLKYDLRWLWARGGFTCTNFKLDTTLVGSLLDENRSNGLDVHAKIYVPSLGGYSDEFDDSVDKSRMDLVPPEKLLPYAGGDTDACLQVSEVMKAELLKDRALAGFYVNILHPAARAFEVLERGGVYVDRDKFRALEADLHTEAVTLVHEAKKIFGGLLVAKHADPSKPGGMNITKPSLLKEYLFSKSGLNLKPKMYTEKPDKEGRPNPSTSMDHINLFKDVPEASELVELLKNYGAMQKTLGTYVTGFLKCLRSDGKLHPSYWFFVGDRDAGEGGAGTGRLSAKDPAYQTIPKHTKWAKRLRECYIAPPGYRMLERDYSQGELRVIACIAGETNMIKAYREGMDLHAMTSGRFRGYSYEEMMQLKKTNKELYDEIRQLGKAGNFGKIYGMGIEGFMEYAWLNYGVRLTIEESQDFDSSFFGSYPILRKYHADQKAFVKQHGYVRSPLGRIRHLPLITSKDQATRAKVERQAINSPTQATLSDMMLWAFAESQIQLPEYYEKGWLMPFAAVHDAGYDYVIEDRAMEIAKLQTEIMENLPFHKVGWNPQLKFIADAKLGLDMAHLSEVKFS
jgi:DNA polymerase I-like protein with 3'-5' exonuclease and polymerase domains